MGQLDESDLERVTEAVREATGEYPVVREQRQVPLAVIATIALAAVAGVAWSVRADERGKTNEKQIEELRAAQAKDHDVIVRLEVLIPRLEEAAKRMTEGRR